MAEVVVFEIVEADASVDNCGVSVITFVFSLFDVVFAVVSAAVVDRVVVVVCGMVVVLVSACIGEVIVSIVEDAVLVVILPAVVKASVVTVVNSSWVAFVVVSALMVALESG